MNRPAATTEADDPLLAVAALARAQRQVEADHLVKRHVALAVTLGLVPFPLLDLALLTGNQFALARALATHYGVAFAPWRLRAAVLALLGGTLPLAGVAGLTGLTGLKVVPGLGALAGSSGVALLGGTLTYAVGRVLSAHFAAGGDLGDFEPARWRPRFDREVAAGRAAVADLYAHPAAGARAAAAGAR